AMSIASLAGSGAMETMDTLSLPTSKVSSWMSSSFSSCSTKSMKLEVLTQCPVVEIDPETLPDAGQKCGIIAVAQETVQGRPNGFAHVVLPSGGRWQAQLHQSSLVYFSCGQRATRQEQPHSGPGSGLSHSRASGT